MKLSMILQMYNLFLSFLFGDNNSCVFSIKKLNYAVINLNLPSLSTLIIAEFTTSKGTDITWQTSVILLRPFTMCGTFTTDCWFDKSIEFFWERALPEHNEFGYTSRAPKTFPVT